MLTENAVETVTIKTNNPDVPTDQFVLRPGQPRWATSDTDDWTIFPFTADVSGLYVTNPAPVSVILEVRALLAGIS
jgi:hypothetical protein